MERQLSHPRVPRVSGYIGTRQMHIGACPLVIAGFLGNTDRTPDEDKREVRES